MSIIAARAWTSCNKWRPVVQSLISANLGLIIEILIRGLIIEINPGLVLIWL